MTDRTRIEKSVEIAIGESFESAKLMKWKLACPTPSVDRLGRDREQFGECLSRIIRFGHGFCVSVLRGFNLENRSRISGGKFLLPRSQC